MDKSKIEKKVHREVLAEMRAEYAEEIRNCIKVLAAIRDGGKTDKDKTDASYKLARLLGMGISSQISRQDDAPTKRNIPLNITKPPKLSSELQTIIDKIKHDME